jgi:ATP-binding cassette subfamily F protein 3
LSRDKPTTKATGDKPKVKKASRDEILALRAEVRKCEGRLEKLMEMHEKLSAKLADPELYSDKNIADLEVWNKKFAEVEEAMSRAETLWVTAQEKLDTAENKG